MPKKKTISKKKQKKRTTLADVSKAVDLQNKALKKLASAVRSLITVIDAPNNDK